MSLWLMILLLTVSGLVIGLVFKDLPDLVAYIKYMDQGEEICDTCPHKDKCPALKEIGKSNLVTEFTYTAYRLVKKQCMYELDNRRSYMLVLTGIQIILYTGLAISKMFTSGYHLTDVMHIGWIADIFLCCLCTTLLLCIGFVDWKTQYIPVEFNLIVFVLGLFRLITDPGHWVDRLIGLVAVSVFLLLVDLIAGKLSGRGHVIGGGDIKLMAAAGLFIGWKLNIVALIIGCALGSLIHLIIMKIGKGEHQLAFGPYLSMGLYIAMICGEQLMSWYLKLMGL